MSVLTTRPLFWGVAAAVFAGALAVAEARQQPRPGGRGAGVASPRNAYPDRPPEDSAAVERGKALYGVNCQFCHGADIRGGDSGPSLLRSQLVQDAPNGDALY